MSRSAVQTSVRRLRSLLAVPHDREQSDEQLLAAFADRRDESAFAVLVRRHGPMVLNTCRRVLGHEQDAEDAFQATFVVLARRAAALRHKSALAGFLHGTAYHLASKSKRAAGRRRKHEGQAPPRPLVNPADELSWREIRTLLDEEIARLPEKQRTAFVLCCLENLRQAEAARRLGLNERTLSSQVAAARKRLSQQLARRGVELTAVLAASALAAPSALPAGLMTTTMNAVLATAAGEGAVSASVAALVDGHASLLRFGKSKLALLLAMTLLGGGAWLHFQPADEKETPPAAAKAKPATPERLTAKEDDKEHVAYAGRVLDPDGKPVAGAKLYLLYCTPKELPIPVRASSDKDGRFRFTIARKEFDRASTTRPWDVPIILATAKGYGLGLPALERGKRIKPSDWELRLCKDDVPITGRILDLQGKPIAGVSVGVHGLFWSPKEDLTAWLAELKEKKEGYPALYAHLSGLDADWMRRDLGKILPSATTGTDGRFVLRGVGRERVVPLRLQGQTIAAAELFVMTRPGGTLKVGQWQRDYWR